MTKYIVEVVSMTTGRYEVPFENKRELRDYLGKLRKARPSFVFWGLYRIKNGERIPIDPATCQPDKNLRR